MPPFIYLASPFEKVPDREAAIRDVTQAADALMGAGFAVHAPIVQSAQLRRVSAGARERSHEDWLKLDLATLDRTDALVVLCIDGWAESAGIETETQHAKAVGIPIVYWREGSVFAVAVDIVKAAQARQTVSDQLADVTTRLNRIAACMVRTDPTDA